MVSLAACHRQDHLADAAPATAATLALLVKLILRQRSLCLADLARGSFAGRAFNLHYQQLWR